MTHLTRHAGIRCQQRVIRATALDLLLDYGEWRANGDGTSTVVMTRDGRRRIADDLGEATLGRLARSLDIVVVIAADAAVITTYWREISFQRDRGPAWERRAHAERRRQRRNFR